MDDARDDARSLEDHLDAAVPEIQVDPRTIPAGVGVAEVEAVTKAWAGAPSDGGAGGSVGSPHDESYDPSKKPSPFTEVGASGLAQYGGFVRDEFLTQLQGDAGLRTYREMWDNDAIVGALVFAVQMLCRKVEWRVEPPEAATVEEIVNERFAERKAAAREQQQAQQAKLQMAQAGLAAGAAGGPKTMGPDGKPAPAAGPPRGPTPSHAQGVLAQGPGFHQGLGTNTNAPATPDTPGSNPSGGNAQESALQGKPGLPQPGSGSSRVKKMLDRMLKAGGGGGGGGGQVGAISGSPVDAAMPLDPETGEPMEFAIDEGLDDITPEAFKQEELAVFVETCFHDMADSWADVLAQIMTFIVFGFSFHEIVYKKRNGPNPDFPEQGSRFADGKVGWSKIAGRAQETRHRWEFDDNGNVIGMWQLAPPKFQMKYIPMQKALLFRTTAYKGNPEGRSILRSAYRSWFYKRRIEEYEAIGIERNLAGLPVAYVPYQMMTEGATNEEKAALFEIKKIVRNLRRNEQEGVVFPNAFDPETKQKLYELVLLSSSSGGTSRVMDTDKVISRYEQRIAMTALADILLLGHEGVGARSLGETKVDLFTSALEAFLSSIADVFNTYAIPRLLQLNNEDPAMIPKLTFGKLEQMNLTEVAAFITALAGAGADIFPDTQLEDSLRERAGLPPKAASSDL